MPLRQRAYRFYLLQRQRRSEVQRVKADNHFLFRASAGFQFNVEPPERIINLTVVAIVKRAPATGRRHGDGHRTILVFKSVGRRA